MVDQRQSRTRRCCITVSLFGMAVAVSQVLAAEADRRIIVVQIPVEGVAKADAEGLKISLGTRIVSVDSDGVTVLTPGFDSAGRPDISFDGRRMLFVGRNGADAPLAVWEMSVDGGDARRVVAFPGDVASALYLPPIYTLDSDPANTKPNAKHLIALNARQAGHRAASLYTCTLDGGDLQRISFSPDRAYGPRVLSDGRLLFSVVERGAASDDTPVGSVLMTVNTDGTDIFPFAGVHQSPMFRRAVCETADGRVVYIESSDSARDGGGRLVTVSRTNSLHSRRVLTNGSYRSASPVGDGHLLVSYRPDREGTYAIYDLDPKTGERGRVVYDDLDWHDIEAHVAAPRRMAAGRSSVVRSDRETGWLYCLDAYREGMLRRSDRGKDKIARVRFIGSSTILGELAVEADGSFYAEVPARTPFRLQTLAASGDLLREMKSWMWVMPNEARGCIGCHEDRQLTPPNHFARALGMPPQTLAPGKAVEAPTRKRSDSGEYAR
jgi:Hydrazine synthase alpha subunit middle domain